MYRGFKHKTTCELAKHATVPVLNGLDDMEHPCQALADIYTILELRLESAAVQTADELATKLRGVKLAYVGDGGTNVCNSLIVAAAFTGIHLRVGSPPEYQPSPYILERARAHAASVNTGAIIEVLESPTNAVHGADVVYTDVWVSMGVEAEREAREATLAPYQVNQTLLEHASPGHVVMHCLPAHRGKEITDDVLDGPHSVVFQQAENRLHTQKALLLTLMGEA
jgi:ornithine carbamoyltransferase